MTDVEEEPIDDETFAKMQEEDEQHAALAADGRGHPVVMGGSPQWNEMRAKKIPMPDMNPKLSQEQLMAQQMQQSRQQQAMPVPRPMPQRVPQRIPQQQYQRYQEPQPEPEVEEEAAPRFVPFYSPKRYGIVDSETKKPIAEGETPEEVTLSAMGWIMNRLNELRKIL